MKYYEILNFQDEPFSNSPDPDFFYESPKHLDCLNRLEIALRLKRGLNVVLGDVGTGKTTLCRRLLRILTDDEAIDAHLLLDPDFDNPRDLLVVLCEMLEHEPPDAGLTEWSLKERVKNCLFKRGVDEDKTIVLIIDEGQKIHDRCMELLRELLNYETNDSKLLQIVIFAQLEFEPTIRRYPNFADRINDLIRLGPLDFRNTRELIDYRINLAKVHMSRTPMFTWGGYLAMHRATGGYPRKIVKLAHKVFLTLILNNDHRATWRLVRSVSKENYLAEATKLSATKTEIGATKSLFAKPQTSSVISVEPESEEVEGARYAWAAGIAMVLLVMLVAVRVETPSNAPLVVGSSAKLEIKTPSIAENQDATQTKSGNEAPAVVAAVAEPASQASSQDRLTTSYRAMIVARNTPADSPKPEAQSAQAPDVLGTLTVRDDTSISALLKQVYGRSDAGLAKQVIAMNESLGDGKAIPTGTAVTFPVGEQSPPTKEIKDGGYVVQVGRYDSLEAAYSAKLSAGEVEPETAILPQWSAKNGLVFSLVYAKAYDDEGDALRAVRAHGPVLVQPPEIVAAWDEGAVLLADLSSWQADTQQAQSSAPALFPPPGPIGE